MGLIPTTVIKALGKIKGKKKFISSVIWRTIAMQKTIGYMMKEMKKHIMTEENETSIPKVMEESPPESVVTGYIKNTKTAKPLADRTKNRMMVYEIKVGRPVRERNRGNTRRI